MRQGWLIGTMIILVVLGMLGGIVIGMVTTPRAHAESAAPETIRLTAIKHLQGISENVMAFCDDRGNLLYATTVWERLAQYVNSIAVVPGGCRRSDSRREVSR